LSIRDINRSNKVSVGAIQKLLARANELGLTWPLPSDIGDNGLAQPFYLRSDTAVSSRYQIPDWPDVHQELKLKGMTKLLLWEEYTREYRNRCYSYSQFCDRYQRRLI
jgi:transposase